MTAPGPVRNPGSVSTPAPLRNPAPVKNLTPLKSPAFRDPRLAPLLRLAAAPDLTSTTVPTPPPSTTVSRLRRAQVVTVIVLLVLGAVAAVQQFDLRAQLSATPQLAGQYDRLATVEAQLIEARNLASLRTVGVAGADPAAALDQASAGLIAAAAQRPADQATLATLSQQVLAYAALLQAPTSAAQLAQADQLLSGTLQPTLQQLRATLQAETGQRSWSYNPALLWLAVALAAVGLLAASVQVAQRTHRSVNIGLFAAIVAALVSAWLGLAGLSRADSADQANRTDTFERVVTLSQGRLALADLRRQLTGAAVTHTASPQTQAAISDRLKELSLNSDLPHPSTSAMVDGYVSAQSAATKGDWAKLTSAVTQAADSDKVFLLKLGESSASAIATGTDTTQGALNALLGQAILALIFAFLGAGAGYWGISRRLREYR